MAELKLVAYIHTTLEWRGDDVSFSSWVCVQEWSNIDILGRVLDY